MPPSSQHQRRRAAAGRRRSAGRVPGPFAALLRRRLPATALAVGAVLGLGAGAATGAFAERPVGAAVSALVERDVTRTPEPVERTEPSPDATTTAPRPSPSPTPGDAALERAGDATALPDVDLEVLEQLPLPAPPAAAAVLDPDAVDAAGLTLADRQAGLLSRAVPERASGTLHVVPGSTPPPVADRPVRTIRVEVEVGLDVDPARFAETVMAILNDPRGWGADGSLTFARTDGPADIRVVLASPGLVDDLCAPLDTVGLFSCGTRGHAVLNHMRWVDANDEFPDRTSYRQYLVNHEVGHLLGHRHVECPGPGQVAPLMQQQTIGVAPCVANGWPFPG